MANQQGYCFLWCGYTCLFHCSLIRLKCQGLRELCVFMYLHLSATHILIQSLCSPPSAENSLYMNGFKLKCHFEQIWQQQIHNLVKVVYEINTISKHIFVTFFLCLFLSIMKYLNFCYWQRYLFKIYL